MPAEVMGAKAEEIIYYGKTPNWHPNGERGFQDDEMWVDFPQLNSVASVEAGGTIGYPHGETEPLYFVARTYCKEGPGCYYEYVWPSSPGYNTWFAWDINERFGLDGNWCVTWRGEESAPICYAGFPDRSKELEAGLEYATTTASGADNHALLLGWEQLMDGAWYPFWESLWNVPVPSYNLPLCVTVPVPGHNHGSVTFVAPRC